MPFRPPARCLFAVVLTLAACTGDHVSGPLPQEAYVWQRSWGPEVRTAISGAEGIAGLTVLAAEIDPAQRPARVVRVQLESPGGAFEGSPGRQPRERSVRYPPEPWRGDRSDSKRQFHPSGALNQGGGHLLPGAHAPGYLRTQLRGFPLGLALRIGAFPGRFADDPSLVSLILETARKVLQEAHARGLFPSEIQIDYDCPESKLDDYVLLVRRLTEEVAPVPVTITALPSWLRHRRALGTLVNEADGWVLQVHSVARPGPRGEMVLCDPAAAREAVERAARFGRPFRVALPTYGYEAAFDPSGKLVGLSAEGWPRAWPAEVTVREVRSDPVALAGLVRAWMAERPRELAGLIWYRLPVEGDRRNWSWATLAAVMAGRVPRPEPRLARREPSPGLVEIDLVNEGDGDAPWPAAVRILWKGDRLLAADALAGYRALPAGPGELRIERSGKPVLRPGERQVIAWLRFTSPTEVLLEVPTPPAG